MLLVRISHPGRHRQPQIGRLGWPRWGNCADFLGGRGRPNMGKSARVRLREWNVTVGESRNSPQMRLISGQIRRAAGERIPSDCWSEPYRWPGQPGPPRRAAPIQLNLRASAWNRRENRDSGPAITLGFQGNAMATPPPITCENLYDALKLSCMRAAPTYRCVGAALRGGPAARTRDTAGSYKHRVFFLLPPA